MAMVVSLSKDFPYVQSVCACRLTDRRTPAVPYRAAAKEILSGVQFRRVEQIYPAWAVIWCRLSTRIAVWTCPTVYSM